ncbi:MAG: N-formylglutamate amidohydrolase [Sphingomicrobium sp.]
MFDLAPPLISPARGTLPVILSVPHSGRDYPAGLVTLAAAGRPALERLEDPLVDRLAWRAMAHGFGAVVARAPRAAIDCNRALEEVDPAVVVGASRERLSARTRGGLGLVPARTRSDGFLWRRSIGRSELDRRIASAHRPYHEALASLLAEVVSDFGTALLLDLHSMPTPAATVPPIVVGDAYGKSAARWLGAAALEVATRHGLAAQLNDPYAGGHIVERHGRPNAGVHALQIEIDRALYLDADLYSDSGTAAAGPGFDAIARLIEDLAISLGRALSDRRLATAAE